MIRWTLIFAGSLLFAAAAMGDEFEPTDTQIELAALNDTYRVARGLDAHRLDADLCRLCQRHAEWMASRNSMFHGSGENIVCYGMSTPTGAMGLWRRSGPHNGFLLSGTTRAGWVHAVSASGTHYWAGAFRSDPPPKQDTPDDTSTDTPPQWRPRRGVLGWLRGR